MAFSQENDGGIVKNIRHFASPVFSMDLLPSVILCFRTVETPVPTIINRLSLRFLEDLLLLVTVSSRVVLNVRKANISYLQSKYFIAKRFHLPERANFIGAPAPSVQEERITEGNKSIEVLFERPPPGGGSRRRRVEESAIT